MFSNPHTVYLWFIYTTSPDGSGRLIMFREFGTQLRSLRYRSETVLLLHSSNHYHFFRQPQQFPCCYAIGSAREGRVEHHCAATIRGSIY